MNRPTPQSLAKLAARHNPFYAEAIVCTFAQDNGRTLYDDTGTAIYDEIERTFGYVDRTRETQANVPLENGKALVSVMTELEPSTVQVIRMGGRFYLVRKLHSGDVAGVALRFECTVLNTSDSVPIRGVLP